MGLILIFKSYIPSPVFMPTLGYVFSVSGNQVIMRLKELLDSPFDNEQKRLQQEIRSKLSLQSLNSISGINEEFEYFPNISFASTPHEENEHKTPEQEQENENEDEESTEDQENSPNWMDMFYNVLEIGKESKFYQELAGMFEPDFDFGV